MLGKKHFLQLVGHAISLKIDKNLLSFSYQNKNMYAIKRDVLLNGCCDGLPEVFSTLLTYARELDFAAKPNYEGLRKEFRKLYESLQGKLIIESE